jgi:hypothetical protein
LESGTGFAGGSDGFARGCAWVALDRLVDGKVDAVAEDGEVAAVCACTLAPSMVRKAVDIPRRRFRNVRILDTRDLLLILLWVTIGARTEIMFRNFQVGSIGNSALLCEESASRMFQIPVSLLN